MKPIEYEFQAVRTDAYYPPVFDRLSNLQTVRILHAAMGCATESGELLDALKKHLFYGKPLDNVNLQEEAGDLFWYIAILADAIGFTFEDTFEKNIAKLKIRYPEKFNEVNALVRDLDKEREALEG